MVLGGNSQSPPLLKADRVRVRLSWKFLLKGEIHPESWSLERAVIRVSKNSGNEWNWHLPASAGFSEFPNVELSRSEIYFSDRSQTPAFEFRFPVSSARIRKPDPQSPRQGHAFFKLFEASQMSFQLGFSYDSAQDRAEFKLNSADGRLELSGNIREPAGSFLIYFKAAAHQEDIRFLLPSTSGIQGVLTLEAEGASQGTHPVLLRRFLSLEGALDVRRGSFATRNLLADILGSLRPAVSFQAGTGRDFKGLLGLSAVTAFDMLQISGKVSQEQFFADHFAMKHPSYFIEGEGKLGMSDGFLDLRARLICMKDLSSWLVAQDPAFKPFQNEIGRTVIPFLYRGLLPDVTVEADWDMLAMIEKNKGLQSAEEKK